MTLTASKRHPQNQELSCISSSFYKKISRWKITEGTLIFLFYDSCRSDQCNPSILDNSVRGSNPHPPTSNMYFTSIFMNHWHIKLYNIKVTIHMFFCIVFEYLVGSDSCHSVISLFTTTLFLLHQVHLCLSL